VTTSQAPGWGRGPYGPGQGLTDDELRRGLDVANRALEGTARRASRAEAALARVRAAVDTQCGRCRECHLNCGNDVRVALALEPDDPA
jgi:hypothetical protein